MTALDEERLSELRRLVPPVLSPPLNEVHLRAVRLRRARSAFRLTGAIGLVAVVALVVTLGGRGLPGHGSATTGASPTASAKPALSCTTAVKTSPLPAWARDGFTPPDQSVAHMTGHRATSSACSSATSMLRPWPTRGTRSSGWPESQGVRGTQTSRSTRPSMGPALPSIVS
jgi:hypothetical protein